MLLLALAVVVAGSHKIDHDREAIIAAAYEDRSMIHQVVAPRGSALIFTEALLHATGQNRSDNERAIMIAASGPPTSRSSTWRATARTSSWTPSSFGTSHRRCGISTNRVATSAGEATPACKRRFLHV